MITILYHAETNGHVVKRIAQASDGAIKTLRDTGTLPHRVEGTLVRWDSKLPLPSDKTINTSAAVALSRNKKESRLRMVGLCPETWININELRYPAVVRPMKHFGGKHFYVVNNRTEAISAVKRCGYRRWYASALITKVHEYRVFVFNGEVIKVVRRYHDDPTVLAWNIHQGGKSVRIKEKMWPEKVIKGALDAGKRIGLDLYAADVIVDKDEKAYVLELNTAPGLDRDQTIEMMAEMLMCHEGA